jgi:FkbM family methyltransferase
LQLQGQIISWVDFEISCNALSKEGAAEVSPDSSIYIFGAGRFGRDLAISFRKQGYNILGFVETTAKSSICDGLKVYSWNNLPDETPYSKIAIGIHNRDMPIDDLIEVVKSAGYTNILTPQDCYELLAAELGWRYWLSKKDILLNNIASLKRTYDMLSDEVSKACFLHLTLFRLGKNPSYASYKHESPQYFNELTLPVLQNKIGLKYVDCGAYNGDTYLELSKFIKLGDSYLFEPDPENYRALTQAIFSSNLQPMLLPLAVSDKYKILSFNGQEGEGGTISENGSIKIAAAALDDVLINKKIDFIKIDVEGGELDAIAGATTLIKNYRPVLAISLYHRPVDLWEIPDLLQKICVNYSFFIRQHFHNSFESVIYAIPN